MSITIDDRILTRLFRKEYTSGHMWWDFSLPANGLRWDDTLPDLWIKDILQVIEGSGMWLAVGYTISENKEKFCLLVKDIRKRSFRLNIEGNVNHLISERDINMLIKQLNINPSLVSFEVLND